MNLEFVIDSVRSDPTILVGVAIGATLGIIIGLWMRRRIRYRRARRDYVEQVWHLSRIEDYRATNGDEPPSNDVLIDLTVLEGDKRQGDETQPLASMTVDGKGPFGPTSGREGDHDSGTVG